MHKRVEVNLVSIMVVTTGLKRRALVHGIVMRACELVRIVHLGRRVIHMIVLVHHRLVVLWRLVQVLSVVTVWHLRWGLEGDSRILVQVLLVGWVG